MSKKRMHILLLPLIFLLTIQCTPQTDEVSIDTSFNKNNFPLKYKSVNLTAKTLQLDSIGNRTNQAAEPLIFGALNNNKMGKIKANLYTQFVPQSISTKIPENAKFKSAKIKLYGESVKYIDNAELSKNQNFKIYELVDPIPNKNFYNNKLKKLIPGDGLKSVSLKSFTFNANKDKKTYKYNNNDVTAYQLEIELPTEYGEKLFNIRKDKSTSYISSLSDFKDIYKGLAILPDENNNLYAGFFHKKPSTNFGDDLKDPRSIIEITYTIENNGTEEEKTYNFYFDDIGGFTYKYTQYVSDRTNSEFTAVPTTPDYKTYDTDILALDSKTGLSMKILMNPLIEMAKEFKNGKRIARAHIKLGNITEIVDTDGINFYALYTNDTNQKLFDKKKWRGVQSPVTSVTEFKYSYSQSTSLRIFGKKNTESKDYYLNITVLFEALINDITTDNEVTSYNIIKDSEHIMLYPVVNSLPEWFYLNKEDIKLEVFYLDGE